MALLDFHASGDLVAYSKGAQVRVFSLHLKQEVFHHDCLKQQKSGQKEKEKGKSSKDSAWDGTDHFPLVRVLAFSRDGAYLCIGADDRRLHCFEVPLSLRRPSSSSSSSESAPWKLLSTQGLRKKPTCALATEEALLLVGEKAGDVTAWTLPALTFQPGTEEFGLLGHLALITSLQLLPGTIASPQSFLVSADQDAHIRVSRYPQVHRIQSFCLGHDSFISAAVPLLLPCFSSSSSSSSSSSRAAVVSGCGAGELCLWDLVSGAALQRLPLSSLQTAPDRPDQSGQPEEQPFVAHLAVHQQLVVAGLYGRASLLFLIAELATQRLQAVHTLPLPFSPLLVCFDCDGVLWVVLPPPAHLQAFRCTLDSKGTVAVERIEPNAGSKWQGLDALQKSLAALDPTQTHLSLLEDVRRLEKEGVKALDKGRQTDGESPTKKTKLF